MTTQDYTLLGTSEAIRARRYNVLKLLMSGTTPPEIAEELEIKKSQVYNDIAFLKSTKLNDLPLDMIIEAGANFFELKVRELEALAAELRQDPRQISNLLKLEKEIRETKIESLKLQGAYTGDDPTPPGPIQIIFEEVSGRYERPNTSEFDEPAGCQVASGENEREQEKAPGIYDSPETDPEKEYPRY